MVKGNRLKSIILGLPIMAIMVAIIVDPARYIESALEGLIVFANNVIPSLFPFFFFTRLLTAIGMAESISALMRRPIKLLYNTNEIGGYVFVMSLMSGYPIGAKLLSDLYAQGIISQDDVRRIMPFTSLAGPLFLIGTVGTIFLKSPAYGYILVASSVLGTMLNGLVYRKKNSVTNSQDNKFRPLNIDNVLDSTINSAVLSILVVGGYIVIFYIIGDVLSAVGIVDIIANIIDKMLSIFGIRDMGYGVALSLVEMTRGIMLIASNGSDIAKVTIIAFIVALGGMAVTLQSMTFLSKAKIKVSYYLTTKLTGAIFTSIIAYILMLICY